MTVCICCDEAGIDEWLAVLLWCTRSPGVGTKSGTMCCFPPAVSEQIIVNVMLIMLALLVWLGAPSREESSQSCDC